MGTASRDDLSEQRETAAAGASVSVVIPAYNAGHFLPATLRTVFEQTYSPLEVIVVDDGSEDGTSEVMKEYAGRVTYLRTCRGGQAAATNLGVHAAHGDWIALLDADDLWLPERLERQLAVAARTRADLVFSDAAYVEHGAETGVTHFARRGLKHQLAKFAPGQVVSDPFLQLFLSGCYVLRSTALIRRAALVEVGLFDEGIRCNDDMDLWFRLSLRSRFAVVPEVLVRYRVHGDNMSGDPWAVASGELKVCENLERNVPKVRDAPWRGLLRAKKAGLYRQKASMLAARGDLVLAREAWAQCLHSSFSPTVAAYWMASFLPGPLVRAISEWRALRGDHGKPDGRRSPGAVTAGRMPVSVIIPTRNRPDCLRSTVATVLGQVELPREVIVVDQSETAESREAVAGLLARVSPGTQERVRLTYLQDPSLTGGAQARNRGIELARGEILLFLDDDVELEPTFVGELLRAYEENPEATGVSGVVANYARPPLLARLWLAAFVRGEFRDDRQPVYWREEASKNADPVQVSRLGGGLMSFRAAAVEHVRFDENLTGVCDGEDVDFCMQLGPRAQLLIAPRARLIHKQSPSGRATDHWLRRFSQANCYLHHRNRARAATNRACFLWLSIGMALAASAASIRRLSVAPWAALLEGAAAGRRSAISCRDQCASQ